MKFVNVEEDVDRRLFPPKAHLAIRHRGGDVRLTHGYSGRQRTQRFGRAIRRDEDVHIEIARSTWLFSAIGKCDCAPERMWKTRR